MEIFKGSIGQDAGRQIVARPLRPVKYSGSLVLRDAMGMLVWVIE